MAKEYLDKAGLTYLWGKIKAKFAAIGHKHVSADITDAKNLTSKNNLGWSSQADGLKLATQNELAYWNGQYKSGSSNLEYCSKGAFGNLAVKNNVEEADLSWGTVNHGPAGFSLGDVYFNDFLKANRFAGLKAAGITVEYSTDAGSTWNTYDTSDLNKRNVFTIGGSLYVGGSSSATVTADSQLRITIDTGAGGIYTILRKILIYLSTNYSQNCKVTIKAAKQATPTNYELTICENLAIAGWSGWNVIPCNFTTYGNTPGSQYGRIQFTFTQTGLSDTTKKGGLCISRIFAYGGVGWTTPSNMALHGHAYSWDGDLNVTFPAKVTASGGFSGPVKDSGNGTNTTFAYSKSGLSSATWLAAWNNYELRAISPANISAGKVNGHTVESDVPANAKFTDTTYTAATAAPGKVASASAQGSSANYARQDHTHGIDLATGDANGQVKIAGTNVSVKGLAALAYKASLAKSDVGLGNVDNTADANKSVSSAATLTTARNIDGVDFNGSADIIHFGDCSTAAGTAAKTVNCSGFKLVSGAWIAVQFRSTNTAANPTLNVNGTGAKEIWYRTERLATANLLHIQQMGIYLFVYYLDHYYLVGHMYDIATESEAGLMSATDKQKLTSKAAVSGGTDLSLVTTGEKYNWNNNSASGDITVDSVTITGHASAIGHTNSGDGTKSLANSTSMTKLADMTTLGAGTWLITVGARFTGNATGTRALQIYLDGSADGPGYESGNVAGNGQFSLSCTTVVQSDSSVDVDIYARQNSGAALSVSYYWKVVRIA